MLKLHILQKRIETLEELYPKITSWFVQVLEEQEEQNKKAPESDEFNKLVYKYRETKGKILLDLMDESVFSIENEFLASLRKKLQKLTIHGDPNIPDKFLDGDHDAVKKLLLDLLKPEIPHEKHRELADEFNDTYSGYNYIYNKARTNLLIIKAGTIPESLERYIDEIRECLALWKYLAASTLLRTTLEISVQDLCHKNNLDNKTETNLWNQKLDFWDDRLREEKIAKRDEWDLDKITLFDQIELLCIMDKFIPIQDECHALRKRTNKAIHNEINIDKQLAMELSHRTFQLIHELYEAN
jgi:hypothetical protein